MCMSRHLTNSAGQEINLQSLCRKSYVNTQLVVCNRNQGPISVLVLGRNFFSQYSYSGNVLLKKQYFQLLYDRYLVLVSGTETKVQFRYWYRSRNFFFPKLNSFFSLVSHFLGDISFISLKINPDLQK